MEDILNYVRPELIVVAIVLYFIGMMLKHTERIKDKYIPSILGFAGVLICALYVIGIEGISAIGVFTSITQGIIVAGIAVYANQLIKQTSKDE